MTGQTRTESNHPPNDATGAQDRYRILFERSPDAVIVSTPDGRILDFNSAALDFLSISRADLRESKITALCQLGGSGTFNQAGGCKGLRPQRACHFRGPPQPGETRPRHHHATG